MVAFACAVVLAARPAVAHAAPANGQLAAVVEGRLVTVNADGTGLRTLWTPPTAGEITGLAWSPDGNRLALSFGGRIISFDVAAGRGLSLTDSGRDLHPGWSADGRRIGFLRGGTQTLAVPAEGGEITTLPFSLPLGVTTLAWAPNLTNFVIVVPPLLLLSETPLISTGVVGTPAWAPDGERIAFADAAGLRTVTTGLVPLVSTVTGPPAGSPRWSPDGRSLLYPADGELRTLALNGGSPRTVLDRGVTAADWQPCTAGVTTSCESVSPPHCAQSALNVTTQAGQAVDLPAATCADPAGRTLSLVIAKPPDHGTLAGFRYTPSPGFVGQDSVIYRMSNGAGESEAVRVTVFVVPRPTAAVAPPVLVPVARAPFLNARATPRLDRRRRVVVKLSCDQNCTVALRLTARLRTKRTLRGTIARRSIASGRVISLRLRLPSKPKTALKTVWLTGTVANAARQKRTVKLPVTLPRR
jgi:Bacterial Ig domain/WD40-like Beta Propeller Repeat